MTVAQKLRLEGFGASLVVRGVEFLFADGTSIIGIAEPVDPEQTEEPLGRDGHTAVWLHFLRSAIGTRTLGVNTVLTRGGKKYRATRVEDNVENLVVKVLTKAS